MENRTPDESHVSLRCVAVKKVRETCTTSKPTRFKQNTLINVHIKSRSTNFNYIKDQETTQFVSWQTQHMNLDPIVVHHQNYLKSPTRYNVIYEKLMCLELSDVALDRLMRNIVSNLEKIVRSIKLEKMVVDVVVSISLINMRTYIVNNVADWITEHSIQRSCARMVPATELSIESLERKMVACDDVKERCSICLEEFIIGCEVSCMPCSHPFHVDCIKKWLKISHHCPNCRFEMPTS